MFTVFTTRFDRFPTSSHGLEPDSTKNYRYVYGFYLGFPECIKACRNGWSPNTTNNRQYVYGYRSKNRQKIGPDGLPGLTGRGPFAIFIAWNLWIFAN